MIGMCHKNIVGIHCVTDYNDGEEYEILDFDNTFDECLVDFKVENGFAKVNKIIKTEYQLHCESEILSKRLRDNFCISGIINCYSQEKHVFSITYTMLDSIKYVLTPFGWYYAYKYINLTQLELRTKFTKIEYLDL